VTEVLRVEDPVRGTILSDPALWSSQFEGAELRVLPRRGGSVAVEGVCRPVEDEGGAWGGHVCTFRDVSALRTAEDRAATALRDLECANANLESKRSLLQTMFQSVPCGILIVDREGRIRELNPYVEELFGVRSEEALGRPMGDALGCTRLSKGACADCPAENAERCGLRCFANDAFRCGTAVRAETAFEVLSGGRRRTLRLSVGASLGRLGDEELCFLLIEDRTEVHTLRRALRTEVSFSGIVGRNAKMQELFETIREAADSTAPVIVQGESGTGKELVATAIHTHGARAAGRFVAVNCGALPDTLLESELFGYVKGAFTGAIRDRKGRFELADGGTLFLDEVGELSPAMQVKLLRVVQNGTFERLGSERTISVDVRIISATNRDLQREVAEGRFRRDLFYRLCVVPITVPPLRERSGDIPLLVDHVLARMAGARGRDALEISPEAMSLLSEHGWPGNVRELENVLQFAFVKSRGERVGPEHLPAALAKARASIRLEPSKAKRLTEESVLEALSETHGNRLQAAKRLGVSRATLYRFLDDLADARARGSTPPS
jgi:transcriptional regulator with PAS, ATPase and Fis domain